MSATQQTNMWKELQTRAKAEEAKALTLLGHYPTDEELKVNKFRCALWVREFTCYQKSIADALAPLADDTSICIGREKELQLLSAVMERPLTSVALLLAESGCGKSNLVEAFAREANNGTLKNHSEPRNYMVLALRLGALSSLERGDLQAALANILPTLKTFETKAQLALQNLAFRIILFIDEIHMVISIFGAGTKIGGDVIKDSLARSPIRVIGATTRREYDAAIAVDIPLAERFKVIELEEVNHDIVKDIAKNWWDKYGKNCPPLTDDVIEYVISTNHAYRPDHANPRKTLDTLEDLVSYCVRTGEPATRDTVAQVFKDRFGIMLGFNIDADAVYDNIRTNVLGQPAALQSWNLLLHATKFKIKDKPNKPILTALLTGSTGVGKPIAKSEPTLSYDPKTKKPFWTTHGELKAGESWVYHKDGNPYPVLDYFDKGLQEAAKVSFQGNKSVVTALDHKFQTITAKQKNKVYLSQYPKGKTPEPVHRCVDEMIDIVNYKVKPGRRKGCKLYVKRSAALKFKKAKLAVDPYVMGAFIGDGCLREIMLTISSNDQFIPEKIANLLGSVADKSKGNSFAWVFRDVEKGMKSKKHNMHYRLLTKNIIPELYGVYSADRWIPNEYKYSSIEQRWSLIQGLFDTDGSACICCHNKVPKLQISFSSYSKKLIDDVIEVIKSLGYDASIICHYRESRQHQEYNLLVQCEAKDAHKFFSLPRKVAVCKNYVANDLRTRKKKFDYIGITNIEKVGLVDCNCITVDSPDHTYLVGKDLIDTCNTESIKALSEALYPKQDNLSFFNMADYMLETDEPRFRKELGETLRHNPSAVILLDELEKAHENVRRSLLYILDEGLVNFNIINREGGEERVFSSLRNAIVICTTNAGAGVFKDDHKFSNAKNDGEGDEQTLSVTALANLDRLNRSLRDNLQQNGFSPELLGRFDAIIPYRALSELTTLQILQRKLAKLVSDFEEYHGIELIFDEPPIWDEQQYGNTANPVKANDVCVYVAYLCAQINDSNSGGARRLDNELQSNVFNQIVYATIKHPEAKRFHVKVNGLQKIIKSDGTEVFRINNEVREGLTIVPC